MTLNICQMHRTHWPSRGECVYKLGRMDQVCVTINISKMYRIDQLSRCTGHFLYWTGQAARVGQTKLSHHIIPRSDHYISYILPLQTNHGTSSGFQGKLSLSSTVSSDIFLFTAQTQGQGFPRMSQRNIPAL